MKTFYVYIMTNRKNAVLYTGITNNMERRLAEHQSPTGISFVHKYNVNKLVFVEETTDSLAAITREKQIKGWTRAKKLALINAQNPSWQDLSKPVILNDSEGSGSPGAPLQPDPSALPQDDKVGWAVL